MQTAFPYVHVDSDEPFERGRQLGQVAEEYVRGSIKAYEETFAYYAGLAWPQVREIAAGFRGPIEEYDPEIAREIEGIAAGASVSHEDMLAVNARTEIMFGMWSRGPECTSLYAGPTATADGHVLVGQNWDWNPRARETTILAEVDQGSRPSFAMLAEAGLVGKLGFNSAGVGVAANALISGLDHGDVGVPFHVILRGILNATTIEEAVSAVVRARRASSANYVIASATGVCVDLETAPGGVETVFILHPVDDLLGHSNHFTCSVAFEDITAVEWPDTHPRLSAMSEQLQKRRGSLTRESATEVLKDHVGYPDSICRHVKEEDHPVEHDCSVASWVIDLTERVASVCAGPPCLTEYVNFVPAFAEASALAAPA
ncbi:MAG: isopenicillin-N N-acyltransferase like protein [Gaiellaceae bacterium]|nr:isopenicillin-N N-acyltransferase like protein [Gaiellaceae bacterium]